MEDRVLISPTELARMMETEPLVVIDTRDPAVFAAGHLPGAVNLRDIFTYLATSTTEGMAELQHRFGDAFGRVGLSGKETAVIYEDTMNTGFGQSCRGYFLLKALGYPKVRVLHGGHGAWLSAGMPSTTDVVQPARVIFPLEPTPLIVGKDEMLAAVYDPSTVKLDVRDVDEWIGKSSSPYGVDFCPRKGRIPNSVWIEWYRMMKPTPAGQMFKDQDEILAECRTVGIARTSKVILYCFKGARASNTFLALREAGIRNVKIYFGSWNEWSRDASMPIEEGSFAQAA